MLCISINSFIHSLKYILRYQSIKESLPIYEDSFGQIQLDFKDALGLNVMIL